MQEFLATARRAAREAGQLVAQSFGRSVSIQHKGPIDLVTEVDLASEAAIRQVVLEEWPQHAILGEEGGLRASEQQPLWIVDPLDGTRSFAHGYPFVSISIALEIQGRVELGLVYDPLRDEMFEALRGQGARLNQQPIKVSQKASLGQALLVTGFPYSFADFDRQALFDLFRDMVLASGGIRRDGSAALDFCYLACGRLDGYWETRLKPWDCAAGALLVAEAGGRVSDFSGDPFELWRGEVLASNGCFHQELLDIAAPYVSGLRSSL